MFRWLKKLFGNPVCERDELEWVYGFLEKRVIGVKRLEFDYEIKTIRVETDKDVRLYNV